MILNTKGCVASGVTMLANLLNFGAGNETRTRDPDLGKTHLPRRFNDLDK